MKELINKIDDVKVLEFAMDCELAELITDRKEELRDYMKVMDFKDKKSFKILLNKTKEIICLQEMQK